VDRGERRRLVHFYGNAAFRQERIPGPPQTFRGPPSSDPALRVASTASNTGREPRKLAELGSRHLREREPDIRTVQEQPVNVGCEEGCHANGTGRALPFERQAHRDGIDPQQAKRDRCQWPMNYPAYPRRGRAGKPPSRSPRARGPTNLIAVIAAFSPSVPSPWSPPFDKTATPAHRSIRTQGHRGPAVVT